MPVVGLSVEVLVSGGEAGPELRRINAAFERAGDELADFQHNIFPKLPAIFEAEASRQFDSEGDGPSGHWQDLSPEYERWKSQHYPGQRILDLTGRLRDALTNSSSPFASRVFGGDEFVYGTEGVPYASAHQGGTAKLPARPPVDLSADFESDLERVTREAIRESIQKSGLAEFVEGP